MISYEPFYESLKNKGVTEYQLIKKYGFSANILHRMKKGAHINTKTLDTLCRILGCGVGEILMYHEDGDISNPPALQPRDDLLK